MLLTLITIQYVIKFYRNKILLYKRHKESGLMKTQGDKKLHTDKTENKVW